VEGATERIPAHGSLVIVPGRPLRVDYSGHFSRVLTLELDRTALEGELSAMLGRTVSSAIRFAPGPGLTDPDNPFSRAFRLVRAEVSAPAGLLAHPVTAGHLTRLLMSGLLLGHRHAYSEELRRPVGFVGPRAIREAVTIIEEAPMEIASVADIARKVGLSVRALEVGFRRHLDTTPMRYARRTRMARAHGELRSGDPDRTTAGAVAQHWGFGHYGRFVSEYRQRYGHTPAETLRTPALGDDGGASDRGSRW
jgi:AraC-like DNA-binding protein